MSNTTNTSLGILKKSFLIVTMIAMYQTSWAGSFRSKVDAIYKKFPGEKNLYTQIVSIQALYKGIDEATLYKKFQTNSRALDPKSDAYYVHQISVTPLLWTNGYIKEAYLMCETLQWNSYVNKHKPLLATVYNYTAEMYHAVSNDNINSKKYRLKALKINRFLKDTIAIQSSCINTASMCFLLKQFNEGDQLLSEAKSYLKYGYTAFEPYILSSQLVSIMLQNKNEEALRFMEKNKEFLTFSVKSTYHVNRGIVLYTLLRMDEAETELLQAYELAIQEKQTDVIHKSVKYLSLIYDKKSDLTNAYKYGKLRDSIEEIYAGSQVKTTIDSLKLANVKRTIEMETRLSKARLKESEMKLQNLVIVLSLTFLALIIVILLLIRIRRKNVALVRAGMGTTLHFDNKVIPLNTTYSAISSQQEKQEVKELILTLAAEINDFLVKKQQFKNKDISLQFLAKKLKSNNHDVSEAINVNYGLSLPNLLNKLRIHEAMKLLSDANYKHYSIEGISREVGYESISTFNRNFKEIAGVTPSFFQRESLKINLINLKKEAIEDRA